MVGSFEAQRSGGGGRHKFIKEGGREGGSVGEGILYSDIYFFKVYVPKIIIIIKNIYK